MSEQIQVRICKHCLFFSFLTCILLLFVLLCQTTLVAFGNREIIIIYCIILNASVEAELNPKTFNTHD